MELTREDRALVRALAELEDELTDDRVPDTEIAGRRMSEILRETGETITLYTRPPWYGTYEPAHRLEDLGLLEIDAGIAKPVAPGQPASTTERLALILTATGREVAAAL